MDDEEVKHRQVELPGLDGLTLHIGNSVPSFTQVLRAVKRQEHGLFNCIASVVHDATFVASVARACPGLPLLANLRCGLWYCRRPDATCYFKSTDGHAGQWAFSTTRLNLHVASRAARAGGVVIVDATRRGKTFPVSGGGGDGRAGGERRVRQAPRLALLHCFHASLLRMR
jgi:hypothetical protein